jgi:hypothetical protein
VTTTYERTPDAVAQLTLQQRTVTQEDETEGHGLDRTEVRSTHGTAERAETGER